MTMKEELIEKIKNRTLTMGVCGLGYVGPVSYTHLTLPTIA